MILPLAHHPTVAALPVLAPALVVCLAVLVHYLRERRHWAEEDDGATNQPWARDVGSASSPSPPPG